MARSLHLPPWLRAERRASAERAIARIRERLAAPAPNPVPDSVDITEGACTCNGRQECDTCLAWHKRMTAARSHRRR